MMKKAALYLLLSLLFIAAHSQRSAEDYYNDGMKFAQRGNYKEAIGYFDMAIKMKPDDYFSIHNRGISKSLLGNYGEAIEDFKKVLIINPEYALSYLKMGHCYKRLTFYDTALNCYSAVLELEPDNAEALYNRASMYETLCMTDSAVKDFHEVADLEVDVAEKIKFYSDTAKNWPKKHYITKITQASTDATYGFSSKNPIKVGNGDKGGFENVRNYMAQLKDGKKKPVKYARIKACCPYNPKGFAGTVMLEEYEITYTDATGAQATQKLYLTYYEYEDPKLPSGFTNK